MTDTRSTGGSWLVWDSRSESWVEYVAPLTSDEVLAVLFVDRDRKVYERTGAAVVVDGALTTLATWATRVCVVLAVVTVAVLWWEWIHGWR